MREIEIKRGGNEVYKNRGVYISLPRKKKPNPPNPDEDSFFVGKPIPAAEARAKWPHRYPKVEKKGSTGSSNEGKSESENFRVRFHYSQARVDGVLYDLNDDAYVKAEDGKADYIARIVEMFETVDDEKYFTAQWFYRAEDTVIKDHGDLVDKKQVFISDVKDENPLDCLVSKLKIAQITRTVDAKKKIPSCDFYYDMKYTVPYLTFSNIVSETTRIGNDSSSTVSTESGSNACVNDIDKANEGTCQNNRSDLSEWTLLDLYSGCGAMSTGLCLGASISGIKLVTRWAVDINEHACKSLKLNNPETQVRNEQAEYFLNLLKAWAKLCEEFSLLGTDRPDPGLDMDEDEAEDRVDGMNIEASEDLSDSEEFEVERLLAVCYGDPNEVKKPGLYFKVIIRIGLVLSVFFVLCVEHIWILNKQFNTLVMAYSMFNLKTIYIMIYAWNCVYLLMIGRSLCHLLPRKV